MNKFHFRYREEGKDLHVLVESKSMSSALIYFGDNFKNVEHIYGVFKLPN